MKICTKCKIEKEYNDFSKNRGRANGINSECKSCYSLRRAENRLKNSFSPTTKTVKTCNGALCRGIEKEAKEFLKDKNSADGLRSMCKDCKKHENRLWSAKHKEKENARKNKWKADNKEKNKAINRKYNQEHREEINAYQKQKAKTDVAYKLRKNIRSRLNTAINKGYKAGSAVRDLGCSVEDFKIYLEKKFYDHPITGEKMSWENWSVKGWHIDHNFPLSEADLEDRESFLKVVHYTNLRPMWAEENLSKSNKVINNIN